MVKFSIKLDEVMSRDIDFIAIAADYNGVADLKARIGLLWSI